MQSCKISNSTSLNRLHRTKPTCLAHRGVLKLLKNVLEDNIIHYVHLIHQHEQCLKKEVVVGAQGEREREAT